jgi:hypothetical protein
MSRIAVLASGTPHFVGGRPEEGDLSDPSAAQNPFAVITYGGLTRSDTILRLAERNVKFTPGQQPHGRPGGPAPVANFYVRRKTAEIAVQFL